MLSPAHDQQTFIYILITYKNHNILELLTTQEIVARKNTFDDSNVSSGGSLVEGHAPARSSILYGDVSATPIPFAQTAVGGGTLIHIY